jgi:hypothetical protein
MSWWRKLLGKPKAIPSGIEVASISMPGWDLVRHESRAAHWRDASGDVATLTLMPPEPLLILSDARQLQRYCRAVAESQGSGLVEVTCTNGTGGPCVTYIFKRLRIPAFTFFGVIATPVPQATWVWMVVAYERGTTGLREATVTATLANAGRLTMESYQASWAQDPYDPEYNGVDRKTLCYLSDAPAYDSAFPDHPLTKVRREIRRLLTVPLPKGPAA